MRYFLCFIIALFFSQVQSQERVYHWDWKDDSFVLAATGGIWGFSLYFKAESEKIRESDLPFRETENLWAFDRGAASNYNTEINSVSDYLLFSSFALPFTHYLGKKGRSEGFAIAGMAFQTLFIEDGLTNILKAATKRFRPYTYNDNVPIEEKLGNGARYSFPSGHVATTAATSFFTATVFTDLYPESKWGKVVWGAALIIPGLTGFMRYEAGKHFPTDILFGYAIGASAGYFIPKLHRISNDDMSIRLIPAQGGVVLSYKQRIK